VSFKDEEGQAWWVATKRIWTINYEGKYVKTQPVDKMLDRRIEELGEEEILIRLAKLSPTAIDMLLEFNTADFLTVTRCEELGFIPSTIYKTMNNLKKCGFLSKVDISTWRLNL